MSMTAQEIFDTVCTHLINQRVPSYGDGPSNEGGEQVCLYRGPNGTKCAVGVLIPDTAYSIGMEGMPVNEVSIVYDLPVLCEHLSLLDRLQDTHDGAAMNSAFDDEYLDDLTQGLIGVAQDYGLTVPPALIPYLDPREE